MAQSVRKNSSTLPLRFSSAPFHRTVYTRLSLTKGTNVANFRCLLTRVRLVENSIHPPQPDERDQRGKLQMLAHPRTTCRELDGHGRFWMLPHPPPTSFTKCVLL